jgi:hypothetical protein
MVLTTAVVLCRDSEEADVEKERREQAKGPAARLHELKELAKIYEERGLSPALAHQVCCCCFVPALLCSCINGID